MYEVSSSQFNSDALGEELLRIMFSHVIIDERTHQLDDYRGSRNIESKLIDIAGLQLEAAQQNTYSPEHEKFREQATDEEAEIKKAEMKAHNEYQEFLGKLGVKGAIVEVALRDPDFRNRAAIMRNPRYTPDPTAVIGKFQPIDNRLSTIPTFGVNTRRWRRVQQYIVVPYRDREQLVNIRFPEITQPE